MSRMRWTTYDSRGLRWRSARTRGVAATVALGALALGGVTGTAEVSRADTAPTAAPVVGLDALGVRRAVEEEALEAAHAARVAELEAAGRTRVQALAASLAEDLAAMDRAAAERSVQRQEQAAAARSAELATTAQGVTELDREAAAAVQELERFFAELDGLLGPGGSAPTGSALDTAKRSLAERGDAELKALSARVQAASGALEGQVRVAQAALDAEQHLLEAERKAALVALGTARASAEARVDGDRDREVQRAAAERRTLKQRHAQERLDLEALQAAQRGAAAVRPAADRSALGDRHGRERDQLKARQAHELSLLSTAVHQADDDREAARRVIREQHEADVRAVEDAARGASDAVRARREALVRRADAEQAALRSERDRGEDALKSTYGAAASGLGKGREGLRQALVAVLAERELQDERRRAALDARAAVALERLRAAALDEDRGAARALERQRRAAERASALQVRQAERDVRLAVAAAGRDADRQRRLLDSEHWTLRQRAVAFSEGRGMFTGVGAGFDPATDPGSLHNVARRIGADRLPDGVTGEGVDVALVDTGVLDVPGLAEASVEIGPDFSFEELVPELRGKDTMGHGTHLGGIIAARDAAWLEGDHERRPDRVLGVAPGARLLSVKAGASDGAADVTQVIAAINWVIDNARTDGRNVRVLNLAYGTDGAQDPRIDPLTHAVERAWRAGIVVVVAAGNDGWAAPRLTNPAQDPLVLAIGSSQAVDGKEDVPSGFSEGGSGRTVDLAAPGRGIASLRAVGSSSDERNGTGRLGEHLVRGSGTSQASAVVSGAVALLLQARPELTPDQVKHLLMSTASAPEDADRALVGAGYLRVDAALRAKAPWVVQQHEPSTGTGTLDGARGSVRVVRDGVVLEGDMDVFGRDFSATGWSTDSWSGAKWSGAKWSGATWSSDGWSGAKWSGAKWSSDRWAGTSWSGAKWSSDGWSGAKWSGTTWSGAKWSGAKWSGAKWSVGGWSGAGWGDGPDTGAAVVAAEVVTPAAVAVADAEEPTTG